MLPSRSMARMPSSRESSDSLPLEELPGKGVRLIPQKGLLDAAREPHRQHRPQHRRHEADPQQADYRIQRHLSHTADIDAHDHHTDDLPGFIPHRRIG